MEVGMTQINPESPNTTEVEPKVKVQAALHYVVTATLVGIGLLIQDGAFMGLLPSIVVTILGPLVPAILAGIAAYKAKHQWRYGEGRSTVPPGTSGINTP
jgi:hypothetical protein